MSNDEKVKDILSKSRYGFKDLCTILEILRGEGGCPWDMEQTHESIRNNLIEETYEVIEAIDTRNITLLREELGDVLLQVVFHAQMEREAGNFNIDDVSNDVCAKLVHRHPHIFGEASADTSDEVLKNWEAIKNKEKSRETVYDKLISVPSMTPSLMRATKVSKKSGEFSSTSQEMALEKINTALSKLSSDSNNVNNNAIAELLFRICTLCHIANIDPEEALYHYTNQFIDKYKN